MSEQAKVTIALRDGVIIFEGSRQFVESYDQTFRKIAQQPKPQVIDNTDTDASCSEKDFIAAKKPKGHPEIVTALGFLLSEQGTAEFSEQDIRKAYLRASVRPPKVISQALRDAKNKFDYLESGSEKGLYRLTSHGDRTIRFDLPREKKI